MQKISHTFIARDLISKLLRREPETRFGATGGSSEILAHPFFESLDLQALESRQIVPPLTMTERSTLNEAQLSGTELAMSIVPDSAVRMVSNNQSKFADFDSLRQ